MSTLNDPAYRDILEGFRAALRRDGPVVPAMVADDLLERGPPPYHRGPRPPVLVRR